MSIEVEAEADMLSDVLNQYPPTPERVALSSIDQYPARDVRFALDPANLADMAKANDLPPVLVVRTAEGKLHVSDGCHRMETAKRKGQLWIEARIADGTAEDAFRHSCIINDAHGLRPSDEDKKTRILRAMERWPGRNAPEYADLCGCVRQYVHRVQQELAASKEANDRKIEQMKEKSQNLESSTSGQLKVAEKRPIPKANTTKTKDGKFRAPPTSIRKTMAEVLVHPDLQGMGPYQLGPLIGISGQTASEHLKALGYQKVGVPLPAEEAPPVKHELEAKVLRVTLRETNPAVMARKFASYATEALSLDFYQAFLAELNATNN